MENTPLILFLGRKGYTKGILQAIYALKYLVRKHKDVKLMIAGPMTREYKMLYNKLPSELKAHIIDLGFVDEATKVDALASCDVFLLPSLEDAFGIVYLEAWLFKKPIIGVLGGNVEGLIDNNINGFLIPFKDVKKLALKIEYLLNNVEERKRLGQNGYNKLINNYLLEQTNERTLNLYYQIVQNHSYT